MATTHRPDLFASPTTYNASALIGETAYAVTLELRRFSDGSDLLYTRVGDQEYRSSSIESLVLEVPECLVIKLTHTVFLLWKGDLRTTTLVEEYSRAQDSLFPVLVTLELAVGDSMITSGPCMHFAEAFSELDRLIGGDIDWNIICCYTCHLATLAVLTIANDRWDLSCFRDDLDALQRVKQREKVSSAEDRARGTFFVNGLHRCAAWRPHGA